MRARYAYTPGDGFYDALITAHRGLTDEQSELFSARLLLLLANHIGDLGVLREAIELARRGALARGAAGPGAPSAAPR
jgi:hypothetical protein